MSESKEFLVVRFEGDAQVASRESRQLITEEALLIQVENGPVWTLMRTPGRDRDLAAGFLLSSGIAGGIGGVTFISESRERVLVSLDRIREPGKALPFVGSGAVFPRRVIHSIPEKVRAQQLLFRKTGASHGAALFDAGGNILALGEDLSRHCALDKVIGEAAYAGADFGILGVFLTSRVSAGMVAKAARTGVPLIAAISAASAAAAEAAEKANVTLAGFVRGDGITIYTHPERVRASEQGGGIGAEK